MQISYSLLAAGISTFLALSAMPLAQAQPTITETASTSSNTESSPAIPEAIADLIRAADGTMVVVDTLSSHLEDASVTPIQALNEPTSAISTDIATETPDMIAQDLGEPTPEIEEENDSTTSETDEAVDLAPVTEEEDVAPAADEAIPVEAVDGESIDSTNTPPATATPSSDPAPTPEPAPANDPSDVDLAPALENAEDAPTRAASNAAPEYLDPHPNPLAFPTRSDEVEIVGTQPITLQQAIELARRNNRELQVAELELEQSRAALREAEAARLPTVGTGLGLTVDENDVEPPTFFNPTEEEDANITLNGVLEINYDLYTSGRRSASIRAADANVRFNQLRVETLVEQLVLDVTNDYYDVQETNEQVRISQTALEQALVSLRDAEALERAGVGTRFDVLQAQVDVANARQELTQDISDQRISRRRLVQRLSLNETVDVSAADPVALGPTWNLSLEDTIILAYRNRSELEQQLLQRDIADQQRRAALSALGPQVSLFARYSVADVINQDLAGRTDQRDQYSFGAQMQWTLFDGGATRARADQEEASIAIAETQFADARNRIRLQVEEAYLTLQANQENVQTARLALDQATESLRLARLRFQAGVGTQSDVLRSQTELTRAELNLLQAILGYNRALVALQRSVSNFPDGILSDQS